VVLGEGGVDCKRVDDCNDHKGGTTHAKAVGSVPSFNSLMLEPTQSLSDSSTAGYTNESEQDTSYLNIMIDFTQAYSSSSKKYTNESNQDAILSLFDDQQLEICAHLSRSIVSSSKVLMAHNISKDRVVVQNGALEDKAPEQRFERWGKIEEDMRDFERERNKLIQEVEVHSYQQLAFELEACRAENEAMQAENEEFWAQVDVRRFSFYKPSQVTSKEAQELEVCQAENNALRAQVSNLLRSRDEDRKERLLEATKMSESSEKSWAKAAADEVQMLVPKLE